MKNTLYKAILILAITFFTTSCSSDDNNENADATGKVGLKFDNSFGADDLILDAQNKPTSNNELLKINLVRYIVSNIVLTKADGTTFIYPKSKSYFIADENSAAGYKFELTDVPTGDYTKVKFGIGVDKEQWLLGASGQGDFLAQAQKADLLWNWTAGYKFFALEGTFTSADGKTIAPFMIHTGQTGTDYNYTEVTLDLPTKALVRTNISPDIHIITDLSKVFNGPNKLKLTDYNADGMGAMIMGGTALPLITANIATMFKVDHVHND